MNKPSKELVEAVVRALHAVFIRNSNADRAIGQVFKLNPKLTAASRAFIAESVYELIRGWRRLWMLVGLPPGDYLTRVTEQHLWWIWAASRLEGGFTLAPFPELKGLPKEQILERLSARTTIGGYAVPDWISETGRHELKANWLPMLRALDTPARQHIRVNPLRTTREELQRRFEELDIPAASSANAPEALMLRFFHPLHDLREYRDGLFEIQDVASQRIAPFLEPAPGQRVVDACAGAGGKSIHLAAMMRNKGRIIAFDLDGKKLQELRRRATRAGADNIEIRTLEHPKMLKRLEGTMDRVLCDVPCSGLGALRRNPGIRWRLAPGDLLRLRDVQREILGNFAPLVKPGGKLVYSTCSILPSENEQQIRAFLNTHGKHWKLEQELHTNPALDDCDGFYAARLLRL